MSEANQPALLETISNLVQKEHLIELLTKVVEKLRQGGTILGDVTIKNEDPSFTLKNTTNSATLQSHQGRLAYTEDAYFSLYNEEIGSEKENKTVLRIAPNTADVNDLLSINHEQNGTTKTHKVLHTGSSQAEKINVTNIAYGTCDTEAETAEKVIKINGNNNWELTAGSIIVVKFSETNTASNPKFNVNGTGEKSIWYNTEVITTSKLNIAGYANRPIIYMYDGTQYVFLGWAYDANTTYSNASLGQGYGTCTTAASTADKVVTLSSYSLVKGGIVSVKFSNTVPSNATMNINSEGSKPIYYKNKAITSGIIRSNDIVTFIYDGSNYHIISIDYCEQEYKTYIPSGASSSNNIYTSTISVPGLLTNSIFSIDVDLSAVSNDDIDTIIKYTTAWNKIVKASCNENNKVEIIMYGEQLAYDLPIKVRWK